MGEFTNMLPLLISVVLLVLGFVCGKVAEKRHYESIYERESVWLRVPTVTSKTLHSTRPVSRSELAVGSVVVSVDYFKRMLMGFRLIFGGEIKSYSPLIDRGRREAMLRMKESCPDADLFLNCRLETATISNGRGNSTGTVEVVCYATAVKFGG